MASRLDPRELQRQIAARTAALLRSQQLQALQRRVIVAVGLGRPIGGGPTLDLDFLGGVLDSRITFTRASSATYVNSAGLIASASTNIPRFDYDPVSLAIRGLLIEEARTNLCLRSEEFDNASWTKTDITVAANDTASPDGTSSADKLTMGVGSSQTYQAITTVASTTYTISVFLKYSNSQWIMLSGTDLVSNVFSGWFDIQNGALGSTSTAGAGTVTGSSIKAFGNGWFRCTVTGTVGTSTTLNLLHYSTTSNGSAGRQANAVWYAWGAQLEAGAFATSYIPTTSATVTRALDVALISGANFSSFFNPLAGTSYYEASSAAGNGSFPKPANYQNSAGTARIQHFLQVGAANSNGGMNVTDDGGGSQANGGNAATVANGSVVRSAFAYAENDCAVVTQGGSVVTDTAVVLPTLVDRLYIGGNSGGSVNIHMRRLRYWPKRLPNATLQALTA